MLRQILQVVALLIGWFSAAAGAMERPNILVIWGDDIGFWNLSTNNMGMMGYQTPNIDRIADEGAKFTDYYGQQSCTAGRSAFITGQSPIRTGLMPRSAPGTPTFVKPVRIGDCPVIKAERPAVQLCCP